MGVFLVGHQQGGVLEHRLRQVAMRIEQAADHRLGAGDAAAMADQIALAIVVAVGDHRAVQ